MYVEKVSGEIADTESKCSDSEVYRCQFQEHFEKRLVSRDREIVRRDEQDHQSKDDHTCHCCINVAENHERQKKKENSDNIPQRSIKS